MYNKQPLYPALAVLFALLLAPLSTFAHPGMQHIMGTVTSMTDSSITVETVKHTKVTVLVDQSTKFTNGTAEASLKDLKVGERLVIHAKENADDKLVGAEVKWGASSSAPMDKMPGMDHKH